MQFRVAFVATLSALTLVAVSGAPRVSAAPPVLGGNPEFGMSGTWIHFPGDAPADRFRSYMTYGTPDGPEVYAPIEAQLPLLHLRLQQNGGMMTVFQNDAKVAEWPLVAGPEEIPETGAQPCVFVKDIRKFLPVRALAALVNAGISFDSKANKVTIAPGGQQNPAVAQGDPFAGEATLSGVKLEVGPGGNVSVRVIANHPVRPTMLNVGTPPARVVLDFPHAHWADGVTAPGGVGDVQRVRTGKFGDDTARLVLEVPSLQYHVTALVISMRDVLATIGKGEQVAGPVLAPDVEAAMRATVAVRPQPEVNPQDFHMPANIIPAENLVGKIICVDAGHGGHDPGAVRAPSEEKAFTLQMCQELKRALEQRGAHVVMTRDADSYVTLDQRCDIANGCHADLFISIHLNSLNPPARGNGSETYFHTPQSVRLAHFLHPRLVSAVGERDGGIHNQRFYVVRNTNMPSVLLEVAYISNSDEVRLMSRPGFGTNLAQSLTRGLLAYYGKEVRSASGRQ